MPFALPLSALAFLELLPIAGCPRRQRITFFDVAQHPQPNNAPGSLGANFLLGGAGATPGPSKTGLLGRAAPQKKITRWHEKLPPAFGCAFCLDRYAFGPVSVPQTLCNRERTPLPEAA